MEKLWDDSVLIRSQHLDIDNETVFFECETSLLNLSGLRMETLTHPHLPNNGPGADYEGGFTIDEVSLEVRNLAAEEPKWEKVALASAQATSQENDQALGAGAAINGVTQGWSIDRGAFGKAQALVIRFAQPIGFEGGTRIKIRGIERSEYSPNGGQAPLLRYPGGPPFPGSQPRCSRLCFAGIVEVAGGTKLSGAFSSGKGCPEKMACPPRPRLDELEKEMDRSSVESTQIHRDPHHGMFRIPCPRYGIEAPPRGFLLFMKQPII